jgi:hypothetical protein
LFYWLWLLLVVLLARPRLVVYNISIEELHPVLAVAASRLDPDARWAGNHLMLPSLGVHVHLDSLDIMRNVSLVSSGGRQNIDGWRRLSRELARAFAPMRVKRNPRTVGLMFVALTLLTLCVSQMLNNPVETVQAMQEVFAH